MLKIKRSIWSTLAAVVSVFLWIAGAQAAAGLERFLAKVPAGEMIAGADRYGPVEGDLPVAGVFAGERRVGQIFLNTDLNDATGYSGKPIHVLVALDGDGAIAGLKLVKHSEPIVLIGIPERRILEFMSRYIGLKVGDIANRKDDARSVDMISGATVTVLVIEDSIFRAAVKVARHLGLGGLKPDRPVGSRETRTIDLARTAVMDWETLLAEGAVKKRRLTIGEINAAFEKAGNAEAIARPEEGAANAPFIDLYMAPVNVPAIGESVLGKAEYKLLADRLKPGQSAVAIFANGRYSFKGSGYVRGGLFERIQIIQGETSYRFRDRDHKRLGEVLADGAPYFKEVGLFVFPEKADFDPTAAWRLQLLVQRAIGPIKKTFITFETTYRLAKLLLNSPAVQTLRWAQSRFPALHPGGVVDSAPLMSSPPTGNGRAGLVHDARRLVLRGIGAAWVRQPAASAATMAAMAVAAKRASGGSARDVSTIGTLAPSTMPAARPLMK
ncbi:MAG: FMN-binding protein [Magnetovibrio sp.]|nr:FMN-binding protein [Magnetovibrio sp.]